MQCGCGWLEVLNSAWMSSVGGNRNGMDVVGWKY